MTLACVMLTQNKPAQWSTSFWELSFLRVQSPVGLLGLQACMAMSTFCVGFVDLNSGPRVSVVKHFTH